MYSLHASQAQITGIPPILGISACCTIFSAVKPVACQITEKTILMKGLCHTLIQDSMKLCNLQSVWWCVLHVQCTQQITPATPLYLSCNIMPFKNRRIDERNTKYLIIFHVVWLISFFPHSVLSSFWSKPEQDKTWNQLWLILYFFLINKESIQE